MDFKPLCSYCLISLDNLPFNCETKFLPAVREIRSTVIPSTTNDENI